MDNVFRTGFVLISPRASFSLYLILLELETCSWKPLFSPPQHLWKHTPCLFSASSSAEWGLSCRELHRQPGRPRPPPRALERMWEVLFPVCWAEGWQLGRINCNYLFISEIWPRSVSVQTVVWSGAQLGIKPPSAPWLQWTGRGAGGPSASQPHRPAALCCHLDLVTAETPVVARGPTCLSFTFCLRSRGAFLTKHLWTET